MAIVELPPPADGEVLVKNLWMSVDAYAPRAFAGLFTGANTGKMLVRIAPDPART
jgi:NADPH-dependent curcumin reductase CurA